MAITVQEAEVVFSAVGMTRVNSAANMAGKAMDRLSKVAGSSANALLRVGRVGVRSLKGVASAAGNAVSAVGRVGGRMAGLGIAGAAAGGAAMLKLAADAETLNTQFKVLTGSQETATKLMGDIDKFAASTPFQKMDIADAARMLLAFGGSADTAVDELKMLGDIAAGTGQPIGELAELYGKAKVQGRLFGEDINQLTGRGIPVIQALAKEFGVAESEVKKLVEKGQVGFPELQRALAGMTGPGGKFAGLMEELSTTTAGKFSTFIDNVKLLGTEMGEALLPHANALLDWAMEIVPQVQGFASGFADALVSAKDFVVQVGEGLQDIGVVVGVVVGDINNAWQGLFEDVQSYAAAAFNWIAENASVMIDNIIAAAAAAPKVLENMSKNVGKELALAAVPGLNLVPGFAPNLLDGVDLKGFSEFNAPALSDKTQSVLSNIDEELRRAREQRQRMPEQMPSEVPAAGSPADQAFVSQQKTADAMKQAAKTEQQSVQRGNALSVFNKLQDSLAGKTLKLQEQQLKTQEQIKEAAEATVTALTQLSGPFVPVLG